MSRFNTFRIINLNYNNNAMKIDDETFNLGGDSTLMSLRNGGGKSVLVQMMMAPFVHKRYRDTKDREFSSYFTSNTPTSILVEWVLDGGAGYVLTGMIVRKKTTTSDEDSKDKLEIINFIYEYSSKNKYDIHNMPLVENTEAGKKIKNLNNIKSLFETLKKDRNIDFNYYDMNSSNHSKSYFDKLKEYKINSKEWESIIKKVNLKESGLSELFTEAKDVTGLVDKWFIKTVEDKLDKDGDRLKKFSEIVLKYIKQYKENKSKIDKKEAINEFKLASDGILEAAQNFKDNIYNTKKLENKIANLYKLLNRNLDEREGKEKILEDNLDMIKANIDEIKYEKLSLEIYNLQDERDEFISLLESINEEINSGLNRKLELERDKNIQECSKVHVDYMELSREVQEYESQLEIIKQKDEDLGPERNDLGYTLGKYYKSRSEEIAVRLTELQNEIKSLRVNIENETIIIKNNHKESQKLNNNIGRLEGTINSYNKIEEDFNKKHNESLMRNIVGYYDETLIYEKDRQYNLEFEGLEKSIKDLNILKKNKTEESKSKGREKEDLSKELEGNRGNLAREEEKLKSYENSIEERKNIIRYIGLNESKLFNTEEIVLGFDKKLNILKNEERNYQISLDKEEQEYNKLKTGKVLELPKEFEEKLEKLDITPVYGMEWLKRNSKSQSENLELVEKNPFIPYSLILGALDLEKLDKEILDIFTSYPIPIIKREDLELKREKQISGVYSLENISFLIAFNSKLIDEDGLKALIESKEIQINKIKEKIDLKNEDIKLYQSKIEKIKYDKVEKELYEKCILEIENKVEYIRLLDGKINSLRVEVQDIDGLIENTQQLLKINEINRNNLSHKINDFKSLSSYYKEYDYNKKSKEKLVDELNEINESIKIKTKEVEVIGNRISKCEESRQSTTSDIKLLNEKVNKYEGYKQGEEIKKDIEDIEARYESIVKEITEDEKTITERLSSVRNRFDKKEEDITHIQAEYSLKDEDFIHVKYDRFIENTLKDNIKKEEKLLASLSKSKSNKEVEIAVKEQEIKGKKEKLNENNSYESLKPREEIVDLNFKSRILGKKHEANDISKELVSLRDQKGKLNIAIGSLTEFDNLAVEEELDLIIDLENLNRFTGEIKRDYTNSKNDEIKRRRDLGNEIGKASKIEAFKEDFFRKPLEILESICDNPADVIENLNITIYSYNTLIEKLEADIELIQREKDNVLDILFQYINDVHHNIGKIDKNSTVNIRGKSVKMLKITIPSWEENEELYKLRLRDMVDRVTTVALEILDKNENIEDLVSKEITTRNMYNEVVSISNIDVKLYKIEEEREVLISWGEVSKNSGGEGFLSAFVVLSSLLSFIRRDDTDIFADNESGKVLVMDNPFAQTNAAHLLKPLMDVAKKSNTQLICLSGLGGDSIYNRFDNIYVLNLVSSKLRGGLQYLRGEHKKGEEDVERIVASNIKIEESEQIHLF